MKIKIKFVFIFILLTTISCTVDVPDTDMQPPKFSFEIKGDGFSHTFTESDDFANIEINIKEDTNYEFTFSGSDNRGLKNLIWTFPGGLDIGTTLNLPEGLPIGWHETSRYDSSSYEDGVVFEGHSENHIARAELSGEFSIYSGFDEIPYHFDFIAMDYGGMNGNENISSARLNINLIKKNISPEIHQNENLMLH